ncbi:hypothetical protein [Agrobacterium pusense]|uniref:hypothetical protein n=1 Tax=Agrobacterium pusense TaxID=648995 RepID=UPI0028A9765E|nr:hypothetical protein [Agrobacterium pusense]
MPRNGSGIYSKPAGTTAVPNTTIESSKYNQVIDDLVQDANSPRPVFAGGTGGATPAEAQVNIGVDPKLSYASKSGNYTAVAADNNTAIRFTAAATLSLTAAATLGTNWHAIITAGNGDVTIDPDASEQINGAAMFSLKSGGSILIICTGSGFIGISLFPTSGGTMTGNLHVGNAHLYIDGNIAGGSTLTMTAPAGEAVVRILSPVGQAALIDLGPNGVPIYYWRIAALGTGPLDFIRGGGAGLAYRFDGSRIWAAGYGWLDEKFADRNARVNHDSAVWEFGSIDPNFNARVADAPAPYVLIGLRSSTGTNVINLRAVLLRNN